jgi:hypothetical protein
MRRRIEPGTPGRAVSSEGDVILLRQALRRPGLMKAFEKK